MFEKHVLHVTNDPCDFARSRFDNTGQTHWQATRLPVDVVSRYQTSMLPAIDILQLQPVHHDLTSSNTASTAGPPQAPLGSPLSLACQ